MTLQEWKSLLLKAGPPVSHYQPKKQMGRYMVWTEYGGRRFLAGDRDETRIVRIQVDLFTKTEYDPAFRALYDLLDAAEGVAFSHPLTDFENDTGYIHHIFDCEVLLDGEI